MTETIPVTLKRRERCQTCKHWHQRAFGAAIENGAPVADPQPHKFTLCTSRIAGFWVHNPPPDFGCRHWEQKSTVVDSARPALPSETI